MVMSLFKKSLLCIFVFALAFALFSVVFKPVLVNMYISFAKKYTRGQFVCKLDKNGRHVGKLYKVVNGKMKLIHTSESNSCIFSRPKINAGFFVLAIGGGGGATPYEGGSAGQVVSKHIRIDKPVVVIKIGRGGNGTFVDGTKFIDAKDGTDTTISETGITAHGGAKSNRMTPLGHTPKTVEYHIPEKYLYLYDIPKSAKYGAGGQFEKNIKKQWTNADNGHSGIVIIQW